MSLTSYRAAPPRVRVLVLGIGGVGRWHLRPDCFERCALALVCLVIVEGCLFLAGLAATYSPRS